MNSCEKFEPSLRDNRIKFAKLNNTQLVILQRNTEIGFIDVREEVQSKIDHHLRNLEQILRSDYHSFYKPLTSDAKRIYGNERYRMKLVRGFIMQIRTRIEPVFTRSDIFDPSEKLKNKFENLERGYHRELDFIDARYPSNQHRWPFYLDVFETYKLNFFDIITQIRKLL